MALKSTVDILDERFRFAMKLGRADKKAKYDILILTAEQKNNIMEYMRYIGKSVSEAEL